MDAPLQSVRCCIVGGGPAGMMAGFLLARAGVEVAVLEKHPDFFRDFRGDTIHPSTLELMRELGLLDEFLKQPHDELTKLSGVIGGESYAIGDFSHLPTTCKFLAFMPQWDFLNFLAEHAKRYPAFHLLMQTEATDLITSDGRIAGVRARTPNGECEIHADLTIGCDGRSSLVREKAGLTIRDFGAPMDVLWMRISRKTGDPAQTFGHLCSGSIFIMINRTSYWQCGWVIPKGSFPALQDDGLDAFRQKLVDCVPFLRDRASELNTWDDVRLLTVRLDRLDDWARDGLLCIGDAAHAMSPIGGVGINLAIQDAVAAANLLYAHLLAGRPTLDNLRAVQRRRLFPTRVIQGIQLIIQRNIVATVLRNDGARSASPPGALKLLQRFPILQRIPAYLVGIGPRPEHIHSPAVRI